MAKWSSAPFAKSVMTSASPLTGTSNSTGGLFISALKTNTATVFIGDLTVTIANGFPLEPGSAISLGIKDPTTVYVVAASAQEVRVLSL